MEQVPQVERGTFLLRIVASADDARAGEEIRFRDPITIGRVDDCDVVLADTSVSRHHASVEHTGSGSIKVVDLGTSNGVWVGTERVAETVVGRGGRFRIGSTVFEYHEDEPGPAETPEPVSADDQRTMFIPRPALPATPPPPPPAVIGSFIIRVVKPSKSLAAGAEFVVEGTSATIGRAGTSTVVIDERDVSRKHATIEATPQGFLITDLGSTCGVWLDSQQITSEIVAAGRPFRVGDQVVLECLLPGAAIEAVLPDGTQFLSPEAMAALSAKPAAPEEQLDFGHTIVMPVSAALRGATRPIEEEGELVEAFAHTPILLDDPNAVFYVVTGGILLFTVALEKGAPVGPRSHFLGIVPGQCFMGLDLQYGMGSAFLAVARPSTTLRKIALARFQELGSHPAQAAAIGALVDTWVSGLAKSLTTGLLTKRGDEKALQIGHSLELTPNDKATASQGVLWVDLWSGAVLFDDMATPVFPRKRTLFPMSPDTWIQPISDEFGSLFVKPIGTLEALGQPAMWHGLDVFHQVLCECEFVNKKLANVDEYVRLQQKAHHSEAAEAAAYDAIGSVLTSEGATPREFQQTASKEPVLRACALVGQALGIKVRAHPAAEEGLTYEELVTATASASSFRTRVVALRDDWWARDQGPMLGQLADTKAPVALLPTGSRSYVCVDPTSGARIKITEDVAQSLSPFAYQVYRPLPEGAPSVGQMLKYGARGLAPDFKWVVGMAVIVGMFGTVTPYLTGQLFDVAIPQADRAMLWTFGLALLASAISSALFKFAQGVATVRVQARMESSIQAAVWDRLLNLPVNFFRKYSAGDLADRAGGVDAIQQLISGAGVAAILGSISGLFYVVQMFTYNLMLAMLAILLTAIFVGASMLANFMQLRYQRLEAQVRGRITGLVLNLISGVSKLRICGAEQHAFRVWALQFAEQRRISFNVGSIQNVSATFGAMFPVLSSIAIFMVVVSQQAAAIEKGLPGMTTGDFIAFNACYGMFLAAMQSLGDASLNLLRIVPIYERLMPILSETPEVDSAKSFPGKLKGEIELSHVSFKYDPDGPFIVKDLSLKIKPGEFVAFVGSSGCGKSTLMRLMLGFEQPSSGSIFFDGQDLNSIDLRLVRQQMGVVMQVSRLMPTEIYRNITGATSRTLQEAWDAAEKASLADDIKAMPMGMHTYVSEGGGTLSGGQRQRLMIARAVVNKPKILFLDEATSALDNRAQAVVTESMDRMDATRIVIAHRLSTIINANKICYLDAGQIVEQGTYQELMDKDGLFAQLAKRQMA